MRLLSIILLLTLLLVSCSSTPPSQNEPISPSTPASQGEPSYRSSLPLVEKPAATHAVALPLISGQGGQPVTAWQLFPQLVDASLPNLNFTMKINMPVISGDEAVQHTAFTQAVQAQVDEWLKAYAIEQLGTPAPDTSWSVNVDYQVTSAPDWQLAIPFAISSKIPEQETPEEVIFSGGHDIISILFEDFAYLGGAHPGTFYVALNYDTTTRKILALADLFKPGTDYLGLISSLSIADLQTRESLPSEVFATSGAAPLPENYKVWAITPQGLLVVFQEYQVGPYAAGTQAVLIPYDALAGQLDPAGPLGFFAK